MGTTSSSLGSTNTAASSAASTTAPLYFTGLSQFSSDFQSIIQRAVQIADIPVQNLQNEQATNTADQNALTALEPTVAALGTDVTNLGTLASTQGLSATSSDPSTVTAINTGATAAATYTVSDITSLASAASETSLVGYSASASVSTSGLVNLVIGSNTYQLNLTGSGDNNISGLAQAITNANAGVSATVLTSGSTDYLAVSAANTGATTLQLNDVTPSDLISSTGTGTETSLQTYTDETSAPVSSNGQIQLVVGSQDYSLNVSANNNLNGLVAAINSAGAGLTASITGSAVRTLFPHRRLRAHCYPAQRSSKSYQSDHRYQSRFQCKLHFERHRNSDRRVHQYHYGRYSRSELHAPEQHAVGVGHLIARPGPVSIEQRAPNVCYRLQYPGFRRGIAAGTKCGSPAGQPDH